MSGYSADYVNQKLGQKLETTHLVCSYSPLVLLTLILTVCLFVVTDSLFTRVDSIGDTRTPDAHVSRM